MATVATFIPSRYHRLHCAGASGDPSPYTARGVYQGIKARVKHRYGSDDLEGIKVAIQGVGNVGRDLAALLHRSRAILYVSHVYDQNLLQAEGDYGATIVDPAHIVDQEVDVFAPCAMGAVLNADTIKRLQASIVASAANNQLADEKHGALLQQRGILYAPDYVINAGGVIAVWFEYSGRNIAALPAEVDKIYETLREIFEQASIQRQPTSEVANQIAPRRLTEGKSEDPWHRIAV